MPSCDVGPSLLEFGYDMGLKHRHDQINMQRSATSSSRKDADLTERKCQPSPFQFHADSNRLLDDDIGIDELTGVKRRRDIENEELKRHILGPRIFDLEQVQDSSLHSFECFHSSNACGTPSTKHLETSVKWCMSGTETSMKTNFDFLSDFLGGNSFPIIAVDPVEPMLEKGSMEAEGLAEKTGGDFLSVSSENADAVSDMDKADLFRTESALDLVNEQDSLNLLVDLCGVEPALEKTSLEAGSLAGKTVGDSQWILKSKYSSFYES